MSSIIQIIQIIQIRSLQYNSLQDLDRVVGINDLCTCKLLTLKTIMLCTVSVRRPGRFDDTGVVDLNRRAESVMDRLDVPMVQSYDITQGQAWATPPQDGR